MRRPLPFSADSFNVPISRNVGPPERSCLDARRVSVPDRAPETDPGLSSHDLRTPFPLPVFFLFPAFSASGAVDLVISPGRRFRRRSLRDSAGKYVEIADRRSKFPLSCYKNRQRKSPPVLFTWIRLRTDVACGCDLRRIRD